MVDCDNENIEKFREYLKAVIILKEYNRGKFDRETISHENLLYVFNQLFEEKEES